MARLVLGVRESRPDVPNFRGAGRMVDGPLLSLISNLQRKTGYACVSERALRAMMHEDTGLLPGVSTLPKALRRLEELGLVEARWIHRACPMPGGAIAQVGMMRLRVSVNRHERRAIAASARTVDRREGTGGRLRRVPVEALFKALNAAADRVDLASDRERQRIGRERNLAAAAEWVATYGPDRKGPPS